MNGLAIAFFGISALATLVGALLTVLAVNPIRSAMALLLAIGGVTGLFLGLDAQFLAAVELIVYSGAVVILFVFVIMLIGPDATAPADSKAAASRTIAAIVFGLFSLATGVLTLRALGGPHRLPPSRPEFGSIDSFGRELFTRGLVPFELSTALFIVAVVGAIAVARGRHKGEVPQPEATEAKRGRVVIPVEYYLIVAGVMFAVGAIGFLVRRNLLIQLMCVELLLNSINLTLVAFNRMRPDDHNGQMFAFFVIAVAAAEAAVGLAIGLAIYRLSRSVRSDEADLLKN